MTEQRQVDHIGSSQYGIALCGQSWVSPGYRRYRRDSAVDCPECLDLFRAYRRHERGLEPRPTGTAR